MDKKLLIAGVAILFLGVVAVNAMFTVDERQQAIVLQFGDPVDVITEPGLKFKVPLIQNVVFLERWVLNLSPPSEQIILSDQRRLDVDTFARYRINDPLRFYQTVNTTLTAETRLSNIVTSSLRRVLGSATQAQVLSDERQRLMDEITRQVNAEAQTFGVEIVDVRIRRADVPDATTQNIFARMRSEREREASEARAQGEELAQRIRAGADRERVVILAVAQREAQILRGEGDNLALRTLAEATGQNPEFFAFHRTLQAYRESLRSDDTTLVLTPQGEFFRYFDAPNGISPQPASQNRQAATPPVLPLTPPPLASNEPVAPPALIQPAPLGN